ncbi:MAG: cell wall-binding repeat-containing protein, partial [Clostridiales bacterium]|nr:cell wall-binding repeat-containing protein [Candidatus Crickella merdequi]
ILSLIVSGLLPFSSNANATDEDSIVVERCYGLNRFDTSIETAKKLREALGGDPFDSVVVANGDYFPDALSGGYLATVKGGPLLIVNASSEDKIKVFISENIKDGGHVYLLGGTGVVSLRFENAIRAMGRNISVERLGGATRFDTNLAILEEARDNRLKERDALKESLDTTTSRIEELNKLIPQYKASYDKTYEAKIEAEMRLYDTVEALSNADAKLEENGIDPQQMRSDVIDAEKKVEDEEKKWEEEKNAASTAVQNAAAVKNNVGWYFLNSKATVSIETWRTRARNYSGTKSVANSSAFNTALSNAVSYDNLVIASQQIDKSNSVSGKSRKIDYNLMTSSAVSVAIYSANHSLAHTYAYKVIDSNYSPWTGENLAYGYSTSAVWNTWYYNEKASNGPHYKQLNDYYTKSLYTGYGYTTKGSPSPSHAQEFGSGSSTSVVTTTSQFRTDLANYRTVAINNYNNAVARQNELNYEPASLVQAREELERAKDACENVKTIVGVNYWELLEAAEKADSEKKAAEQALAEAKEVYEKAVEERTQKQEFISETTPKYEMAVKVCIDADVHDEDYLICDSREFADGLSVSAVRKPVLIVGSTLTENQKKFLQKCDNNSFYIIGGTAAVSTAIEKEIKSNFSTKAVSRIAGSNRYETSVEVAKQLLSGTHENVVLAYGMNFPDGLSGGPLAAAIGAPLVMTSESSAQIAAKYVLTAGVKKFVVLGGPLFVTNNAVGVIAN